MATASSIILSPLAAIYGTVTKTRLALYRRGLLKSSKLDVPVISVGNITAGGTGKTPLVEYFARAVAAAGRSVCILTRGYGRAGRGTGAVKILPIAPIMQVKSSVRPADTLVQRDAATCPGCARAAG